MGSFATIAAATTRIVGPPHDDARRGTRQRAGPLDVRVKALRTGRGEPAS
ncbi:MAG: hypothetical protein ACRDM7_04630 [Thermoleophilaceae bacterium]